ncbi:MAG: GGDEF domain-containing protein [archaeon]
MTDNESRERNRRATDLSLDERVRTGARTLARKVHRYASFFNPVRILKLERDKEQHYEEARTDSLTGLKNRRYYEEKLAELTERCERGEVQTYSVAIIDIDYFKEINDRYGHAAGDTVLQELAEEFTKELSNILKTELRTKPRTEGKLSDIVAKYDRKEEEPSDLVLARYGGEEFVVILPETNLEQAKIAMERVRKKIEETIIKYSLEVEEIYGGARDIDITRTISVGIGQYVDGKRPEDVVSQADERLYRAKALGRNRVVITDANVEQTEMGV